MVQDLKWIVIDVDGTMTDGSIYYDDYGNELKKFNVKDAIGIFALQHSKIKVIILTGRECKATERRIRELNVDYLFQNIKEKHKFLKKFMDEKNIKKENIGYIGDDLNDYLSMQETGYIGCPADSCLEVRKIANYVSGINGGDGAVRDIIIHILQERGEWDKIINRLM